MPYLTHHGNTQSTMSDWADMEAYNAPEGVRVVCAATQPGPGQSAGRIFAQTLTIRKSLDVSDPNEADEMARRVLAGLRAAGLVSRS